MKKSLFLLATISLFPIQLIHAGMSLLGENDFGSNRDADSGPPAVEMNKDSMNKCCSRLLRGCKEELICCESLTDACAHHNGHCAFFSALAASYISFVSLLDLRIYFQNQEMTCHLWEHKTGSDDCLELPATVVCATCTTCWIFCLCAKCYGKGSRNRANRLSTYEDHVD